MATRWTGNARNRPRKYLPSHYGDRCVRCYRHAPHLLAGSFLIGDHSRYELYWTNFQYLSDVVFDTLDEAIAYGRSKGFEFSVFLDGDMVGYAQGVSLNWHEV